MTVVKIRFEVHGRKGFFLHFLCELLLVPIIELLYSIGLNNPKDFVTLKLDN